MVIEATNRIRYKQKIGGIWKYDQNCWILILGPVTFVAAPLYAGSAWGDWFPFVLNYGGGIVAAILIDISDRCVWYAGTALSCENWPLISQSVTNYRPSHMN